MMKQREARLIRELVEGQALPELIGEIKRDLFEEFCADVDLRDGIGVEQVAQEFIALEQIQQRLQRKASETVGHDEDMTNG